MRAIRISTALKLRVYWRRIVVLHAACLIIVSAGCSSETGESPTLSVSAASNESNAPTSRPEKQKFNPYPEIEVKTSAGVFTLKLDAKSAPLTVSNFLHYVNRGLYNGTVFHEVYRDFIALGGGFDEKLTPRPTEMAIRNEAHHKLSNKRGTIAMSRHPEAIDSATCQFFINLADNSSLDFAGDEPSQYGYCVFGEVTSGMEVIDRIGQAEVQKKDQFTSTPVTPIVIESMRQVK